jgi:hypothetical protein
MSAITFICAFADGQNEIVELVMGTPRHNSVSSQRESASLYTLNFGRYLGEYITLVVDSSDELSVYARKDSIPYEASNDWATSTGSPYILVLPTESDATYYANVKCAPPCEFSISLNECTSGSVELNEAQGVHLTKGKPVLFSYLHSRSS